MELRSFLSAVQAAFYCFCGRQVVATQGGGQQWFWSRAVVDNHLGCDNILIGEGGWRLGCCH